MSLSYSDGPMVHSDGSRLIASTHTTRRKRPNEHEQQRAAARRHTHAGWGNCGPGGETPWDIRDFAG